MGQLRVKDAEETIPEYLRDENGNKRRFEPCVIDPATFKRRVIERKIDATTAKA